MKRPFRLRKRQAACLSVLPLTFAWPAHAATISGGNVTATSDPTEIWDMSNGAVLTVGPGTQTNWVRLNSGSIAYVTGATIESTSATAGLGVDGSAYALVNNATLIGDTGAALQLAGGANIASGPKAEVNNSTITGGWSAYTVATYGILVVNDSVATTGTRLQQGHNSGAVNNDSTLTINRGSVTGYVNGVWLSANPTSTKLYSDTYVNNATITSLTGAAITVSPINTSAAANGHTMNLWLTDGTVLNAGNGVAIEALRDTTTNATFDNVNITGDVVSDGVARINLDLKNATTFSGRLVNSTSLTVGQGATWIMPETATVPALTMAGGIVELSKGGAFQTLNLQTLSGSGTFGMATNIAQQQGDLIAVSGNATGDHLLRIKNTGEQPADTWSLTVVKTGGGDARFSVVGGKVDVGVYSYALEKSGNDWVLATDGAVDPGDDPGLSPSARTVIGVTSVAPTVWYAESSVLRSRMGEWRGGDKHGSGVWVRPFAKQFRGLPTDGVDYRQTSYGVLGGVDTYVGDVAGGQVLVGVMLGGSHNRLLFGDGSHGDVDSYSVGVYSTWFSQSGYYLDGTLKYNRFNNEARATMSDDTSARGSYDNNGVGMTLEFGRRIDFGDRWFAEPYVQASALSLSSNGFTLSNGLRSKDLDSGSVQLRVGSALGKTLDLLNGGTISSYVKLAVAQELINSNKVDINGIRFNSDLSGTRVEYGLGVTTTALRNFQFYGEVEGSAGSRVRQPWGVQVGARYMF